MQTTVEWCGDASLDEVTGSEKDMIKQIEEFLHSEGTNSDVTRSGRFFRLEIPTLLV